MLIFISGLIIGCILGLFIGNEISKLSINKILSMVKGELHKAYDEGIKFGEAQPKIHRINEISKEQINYLDALDKPNASAAHARHKNSIVAFIKKLEEEKISLLKSMLSNGSDPLLTVSIDGKTQTIRISKLLPIIEGTISKIDQKTDPKSHSVKNNLQLIVDNTKENSDVQPEPSNPEIH